jgi:hypothetical protein
VAVHGGLARIGDRGREPAGYNCGAALSVSDEISLIFPLLTGQKFQGIQLL